MRYCRFDSVITAVGVVENLPVMMMAAVIAIALMMIASKPLTRLVNAHPTVIILCLGFLLMIGFSLVAEGLDFHIPKGYLYAAIGFSVLIEVFNQWAQFNRRQFPDRSAPLRERTAEAVLRLLGGRAEPAEVGEDVAALASGDEDSAAVFDHTERAMIRSVLHLAEQPDSDRYDPGVWTSSGWTWTRTRSKLQNPATAFLQSLSGLPGRTGRSARRRAERRFIFPGASGRVIGSPEGDA